MGVGGMGLTESESDLGESKRESQFLYQQIKNLALFAWQRVPEGLIEMCGKESRNRRSVREEEEQKSIRKRA